MGTFRGKLDPAPEPTPIYDQVQKKVRATPIGDQVEKSKTKTKREEKK